MKQDHDIPRRTRSSSFSHQIIKIPTSFPPDHLVKSWFSILMFERFDTISCRLQSARRKNFGDEIGTEGEIKGKERKGKQIDLDGI